jgi:SET domain-containing protein
LDEERTERYYINESKFGRGVFANQAISEGEVILNLTGPVISLQDVYLKGDKQCNPLQIDDEVYVDLEEPGLLINHHCNPNCGIRNDVYIVAIRDIEKGEEIFYDYSTTISEDFEEDGTEFIMLCDCEDETCRKKIGDFKHLPKSTQKDYLTKNIVMSFIVKKIWENKIKNPLTSDSKK